MSIKSVWKNVTGTMIVVGVSMSSIALNATLVTVPTSIQPTAQYRYDDKALTTTDNNFSFMRINRAFKNVNLVEKYETVFGEMREPTLKEIEAVNEYINKYSRKTGVNFFDLC